MHRKTKTRKRQRPYQFPLFLTAEEREFLSREAYDLSGVDKKTGIMKRVSQNELVISRTFPTNWRRRLHMLREKQKGSVLEWGIWTPPSKNGKRAV